MVGNYKMRMGDGSRRWMSKEEIIDDVQAGVNDAVDCAEVPALTDDDMGRIVDILCEKNHMVTVEEGNEVVITNDGGPLKLMIDSGSSAPGIDLGRVQATKVLEKVFSVDTLETAWYDASMKEVKPNIGYEMVHCQDLMSNTVAPVLYMFMPNLGLYYQPTGMFGNPPDLMRDFKIEEAMDQAEKAGDALYEDLMYVTDKILSVGVDGLDFDTTASAGDVEFVSCLKAVENIRKSYPDAYIQMGMSAENILGVHGMVEYDGKVVAGMYPHEQVKVAEKAGVSAFGPVVNTNTSKSSAWNIARAVTIVKECERVSTIPLQVNMGMGVGGTPMFETPPMDAISRADKAMVEVAGVDGI